MKKYGPIERYVKSVYNISTDIQFWQSILDKAVDEYENEGFDERDLFFSIFNVSDIDPISGNGTFKVFHNQSIRITTKNLREQQKSFFRWLINSSILKIYNSVELLIQSTIFEEILNQDSANFGKKQVNLVNNQIKERFNNENLGKLDTKNNRHLIQYLKLQYSSVEAFMKVNVRDFQSSWEEFFELISILRNIIAHNGMLIEKDTLNSIRNSARDIFERYFSTELKLEELIVLDHKNQMQILNLVGIINEFSINIVKFMKNEKDLEFGSFR